MCMNRFDPTHLSVAFTRCQRRARAWAGIVYRRALGVTKEQLVGEDWRACNQRGEEALPQAIGRLAWDSVWWEGYYLESGVPS
jgi:hypothetical protein